MAGEYNKLTIIKVYLKGGSDSLEVLKVSANLI